MVIGRQARQIVIFNGFWADLVTAAVLCPLLADIQRPLFLVNVNRLFRDLLPVGKSVLGDPEQMGISIGAAQRARDAADPGRVEIMLCIKPKIPVLRKIAQQNRAVKADRFEQRIGMALAD